MYIDFDPVHHALEKVLAGAMSVALAEILDDDKSAWAFDIFCEESKKLHKAADKKFSARLAKTDSVRKYFSADENLATIDASYESVRAEKFDWFEPRFQKIKRRFIANLLKSIKS